MDRNGAALPSAGAPYPVPDYTLVGEPLIVLLLFLVLFVAILLSSAWQLSRRVGAALLACQLLYFLWTLARNFPLGAPLIAF